MISRRDLMKRAGMLLAAPLTACGITKTVEAKNEQEQKPGFIVQGGTPSWSFKYPCNSHSWDHSMQMARHIGHLTGTSGRVVYIGDSFDRVLLFTRYGGHPKPSVLAWTDAELRRAVSRIPNWVDGRGDDIPEGEASGLSRSLLRTDSQLTEQYGDWKKVKEI